MAVNALMAVVNDHVSGTLRMLPPDAQGRQLIDYQSYLNDVFEKVYKTEEPAASEASTLVEATDEEVHIFGGTSPEVTL